MISYIEIMKELKHRLKSSVFEIGDLEFISGNYDEEGKLIKNINYMVLIILGMI